jgi:hypothetical protein
LRLEDALLRARRACPQTLFVIY